MNKTLKFVPALVPLILSGEKISTWRLFDDKNLQEGDQVDLLNKESLEKFAGAVLIKVYEKNLGNLDDQDWTGHEKFGSEQEMYEQYKKYYNREIAPETKVKIIQFKVLEK